MTVTFQKISYKGWENCYQLSNGKIDLVMTADVGPRLIRLGFVGQDNEFSEVPDMLGKTGGDVYRSYGGHRLWHAPEVKPRTIYPDNNPVQVTQLGAMIRLTPPTETTTGIQKELDITMSPDQNQITVVHRLYNRGLWTVQLAAWALSVMSPGGVAIVPLPPRGSHTDNLLPTSTLSLWAYTDLSDPRWTWGKKYLRLRQDASMDTPQKIGTVVTDGWSAYLRNGHLFLKTFAPYDKKVTYPDLGCNVEVFTNYRMLELETLAPLVDLAPGSIEEHTETWHLFADVPTPATEDDIDREILGRVPHS